MDTLPIEQVIQRLKDNCPDLKDVIRALAFVLPTGFPSAYVFQVSERASPNALLGRHTQKVTGIIGVEIMHRHAAQIATGGPGAQELDAIRMGVMDALKGWTPGPEFLPFDFHNGDLISYKDGFVIWRDQYSTSFYR